MRGQHLYSPPSHTNLVKPAARLVAALRMHVPAQADGAHTSARATAGAAGSRLRLFGLVGHHSAGVVVARKAPAHARPRVGQRLAAHVLDALAEVSLVPLLPIPAAAARGASPPGPPASAATGVAGARASGPPPATAILCRRACSQQWPLYAPQDLLRALIVGQAPHAVRVPLRRRQLHRHLPARRLERQGGTHSPG